MFYSMLGIFSATLFLVGDIPYVLDTYRGKIKPQRVTWGIICALNGIGVANQYASGARNSLWLFMAATLMTGAIFIGSLRHGVGGYAKLDIVSICLAVCGVILWQGFDSPLLSILANLAVSIIALIPTYIKATRQPETENVTAYFFGGISAALSAVSVGKLDFNLLLIPVASAIMQAVMVYLLYVKPRAQKQS